MAVPAEFIEELRSRISLSDLISKRVKLVPKGGRLAGLCPFHSEKTPSFYVNDSEGFYHCFGCGVSGDAISYLRESDGMDFMEAVRYLAELAGMQVPASQPQDPKQAEQRKQSIDVLERAAEYFQKQLATEQGTQAKRYMDGRGLSQEIIQQFMLGYAPPKGLYAHLQQRAFPKEMMIRAGLAGISDRDGSVYDYFRNRIMFPIQNRQGRVIAFGARAMGDAQPKYLNSPEGPTFSKKGVLYGWPQARNLIRQGLPLMVAEGYMDVIAITASGVAAALAPLGTALTEQQIELVWKLYAEPIICFDGDQAGQKAAGRAIERIMPLLQPGRTARFVVLPAGQDPDDILKAQGPEGLKTIIASAEGLLDYLWTRKFSEYRLHDPRTQPSARAAFWSDMRQMVKSIAHNQTRTAYLDEVEYKIATMRASLKISGGTDRRFSGNQNAFSVNRPQTGIYRQYQAALSLIISFPELFSDFAEELAEAEFKETELDGLKNAVINELIHAPDLDAAALKHHLSLSGYDVLLDELFGRDMIARLGRDPAGLTADKAKDYLSEILLRISLKSRRGA